MSTPEQRLRDALIYEVAAMQNAEHNPYASSGALGGLGGYLSAGALFGFAAPRPHLGDSMLRAYFDDNLPPLPLPIRRPLLPRILAALRTLRWWWFVHMEAGALYRERVVAGILRLRERPWWAM